MRAPVTAAPIVAPSTAAVTQPNRITATETPLLTASLQPVDTEPLPSTGSIGFAGCSFTNNAVEGYHQLGGKRFWDVIRQYNGGSVSMWSGGATGQSRRYWNGFQNALDAHPDTGIIWWQLCNSPQDDVDTLYRNALLVLEEIQNRVPGALIYISAQHAYMAGHTCNDPDGPARMQALADRLVAEGLALAGPVMGPLAESQTRDGCHGNLEGMDVLGEQLIAFFGK